MNFNLNQQNFELKALDVLRRWKCNKVVMTCTGKIFWNVNFKLWLKFSSEFESLINSLQRRKLRQLYQKKFFFAYSTFWKRFISRRLNLHQRKICEGIVKIFLVYRFLTNNRCTHFLLADNIYKRGKWKIFFEWIEQFYLFFLSSTFCLIFFQKKLYVWQKIQFKN